jgi:hypothetical protein
MTQCVLGDIVITPCAKTKNEGFEDEDEGEGTRKDTIAWTCERTA